MFHPDACLDEAAMFFGKIAVVNGLDRPAVVFLHIAAGAKSSCARNAGSPSSTVPLNSGSPHGPEQS